MATLVLPTGVPEETLRRVQERVVPALEALLAAALERDALLNDVVETRALRRSDVLKTALLRAISHDLRTPLTAIQAAAEPLAAERVDDAERRELAEDVRTEAERLARLIDQLLDLSRLEAGAVEAQPDWVSLEEVLRAPADAVAAPAEFKFSLDPDLALVRADAAQLERAFANLLENSARHSGGSPVSVRARDIGSRVLVLIVDRGPGIPQSQLERVFEAFYRSGNDRTGHRGSGLGLAIARGFLEVNGAKVWAESAPNQGTSFAVELPLEPVPSPEPSAARSRTPRVGTKVCISYRFVSARVDEGGHLTMRGEIVAGAAFPDSELPDHTDTPRRLSQLQGDDPMVIALNRSAQRDLEIQEYTDPRDPRIPRTIVLKPGRRVFKIYNGSCDWVRPSTAELQRYEIRVDGEVAGFTAYHRGSRHIGVRRTEIDPGVRGAGPRIAARGRCARRGPHAASARRGSRPRCGPARLEDDAREEGCGACECEGELHGRRPARSHPGTP